MHPVGGFTAQRSASFGASGASGERDAPSLSGDADEVKLFGIRQDGVARHGGLEDGETRLVNQNDKPSHLNPGRTTSGGQFQRLPKIIPDREDFEIVCQRYTAELR